MNRRLTFLVGHLTGIALGAVLVFAYFANQPREMRKSTIAVPISQPAHPTDMPERWQRHEFNGDSFYIVPLAFRNTTRRQSTAFGSEISAE